MNDNDEQSALPFDFREHDSPRRSAALTTAETDIRRALQALVALKPSRPVSICRTKLEEALMWLAKHEG